VSGCTKLIFYAKPAADEQLMRKATDDEDQQTEIDISNALLISIEALTGSVSDFFQTGDKEDLAFPVGTDGMGQLLCAIPGTQGGKKPEKQWMKMASNVLAENCIRDKTGAPIGAMYSIPGHPGLCLSISVDCYRQSPFCNI
jgi:hypothetical protein